MVPCRSCSNHERHVRSCENEIRHCLIAKEEGHISNFTIEGIRARLKKSRDSYRLHIINTHLPLNSLIGISEAVKSGSIKIEDLAYGFDLSVNQLLLVLESPPPLTTRPTAAASQPTRPRESHSLTRIDPDICTLLQKTTLNVPEAARVIGVGTDAVRKAIQQGDIPSFRVGKLIKIPTAKLIDMLGLES